MMVARCLLLVAGMLLGGMTACTTTSTTTSTTTASVPPLKRLTTPASDPNAAFRGLWRHPEDPALLAWVSSPWAFSTSSYALEGPGGLVLFDTQFLPNDTAAFVDDVEAATGKKVVTAFVLHANPDKFNGTAWLQARGVEVLTSDQVLALIPSVHQKRVRAFAARYQPYYPLAQPRPASFGATSTTLQRAGLTITLQPTGPGCSEAHVLAAVDTPAGRHLFAGDLVANGSHSWLEIGAIRAWHDRLAELRALVAPTGQTFVHPGRGLSGGPQLLEEQETYLDVVEAAVAAHRGDEDPFLGVRDDVVDAYPGLRFSVFLNLGLPAVLETLAVVAPPPAGTPAPTDTP